MEELILLPYDWSTEYKVGSGKRWHQGCKQGQVEISLENRDGNAGEGDGKPLYFKHENIMPILEFRENHCDLSIESPLHRGRTVG